MQFLTDNEITRINHTICTMSRTNKLIEYVIPNSVPIRHDKLVILGYEIPKHTVSINVATYYMKNIILLQCFPDGNHRTSYLSVELFYHKNYIPFRWNPEHVVKYQRDI